MTAEMSIYLYYSNGEVEVINATPSMSLKDFNDSLELTAKNKGIRNPLIYNGQFVGRDNDKIGDLQVRGMGMSLNIYIQDPVDKNPLFKIETDEGGSNVLWRFDIKRVSTGEIISLYISLSELDRMSVKSLYRKLDKKLGYPVKRDKNLDSSQLFSAEFIRDTGVFTMLDVIEVNDENYVNYQGKTVQLWTLMDFGYNNAADRIFEDYGEARPSKYKSPWHKQHYGWD
jgi:hypothetical protein